MKKNLKIEIEKEREFFRKYPEKMVGAYNGEKRTTKDYNGRQILELIQNADDAGSKEILIKIEKDKKTLSISNQGVPFSEEGYRSLRTENLSSKLKKKFIGNKGLGLRSILNWSDSLQIISNDIIIEFSETKRKQEFHKIFNEQERLSLLKNFKFSDKVNPLPFLSIPTITNTITESEYATTIKINYQEIFYSDIERQLFDLKEEVLLFLNNITKIEIQGFEETNIIEIAGNKILEEPITIGDRKWKVFEKTGLLEEKYQDPDNEEKEHYQLKIAIPIGFDNETDLLFTFFPTKVNMEFPFVVHGTFDLGSDRNQLIETEKNKFVLEKLIELIIETAKKVSIDKVSWEPLELLNYKIKTQVLSDLNFYEKIDKKIKELKLFPCVDDNYRTITEIIYYNNDFSNFIKETNNIKQFRNLLIHIDWDLKKWLLNTLDLKFKKLSSNIFVKIIDEISQKSKTLNERVDLIYVLEQDSLFYSRNEKYSLLLNEKKEIINKNISVFTPPTTKSEKFDLPEFIKIDFLNKFFYTKLLNKYNLQNQKDKARELQRKLKEIVKIQSFEPIPVIGKIITETNRLINKSSLKRKKNDISKKMILSLYNIHKDLSETTNPDTSKVQIISQSGKIQLASELYLSSDFPSGELTEDLLKGIIPKNRFVSSRKTLGLTKEDPISVERFLLNFLKVNKHSKIIENHIPDFQYDNFVFEKINKPLNYRYSYKRVYKIDDFEMIINGISKEKLIIWLIKDTFIKQQLNNSYNSDSFRYDKKAEREDYYYHSIDIKPSFIKFQLLRKKIFSNLLITDKNLSFINETNIDYSNPLFRKHSIKKEEIDLTLLELGAKENFSDLSIERVSEIINSLEINDKKGKNARKIYNLAFDHYRKNKTPILLNSELTLFSSKNNISDYYPFSEVYYSDNTKLPKKITNQEAILNFPKRIGESQVSAFFGIKTFKDFKIKVKEKDINLSITESLNEYLRLIKPYLLSIRLSKISIDKRKQINQEVKSIKTLNIEICNKISCEINDKVIELDEFDFINEGNNFYIKTNAFLDLKSLKKNSTICDLVSEIITIVFKVNENTSDFRNCFRNDMRDTEHWIIKEFDNEILQEAKSLLDMSDYQKEFWQSIFQTKHKTEFYDFNKNITEIRNSELGKIIEDIDYQFLSVKSNFKLLKEVFNELKVSITDFNLISYTKINLSKIHLENIKDYFFKNEEYFKSTLWKLLDKKPKGTQIDFLDLISKYENNTDFIIEKTVLLNENWSTNYKVIFEEFLKSNFSFSVLTSESVSVLDKKNKHKANFSNKENDIIEQNKELLSLLYFEKNISIIDAKVKKLIESEITINEDDDEVENGNLITDFEVIPKFFSTSNGKNGPYIPSGKPNKNKKTGNRSEKIVYNHLIEEYGKEFVSWKAKEDEGLHYDMRYSMDKGEKWRFVEVKTFNNNSFILSREEKKFGEANKDKYEIWLVDNQNNIYNFKIFKGEIKYELTHKDYIISIDIKTK